MKTEAAKCGVEVRKYLKALGVSASVKSKNFSMGDSVDVKLKAIIDPDTYALIKTDLRKYQYGHFDGMTDCYEHSNRNDDIPQTKFLHVGYDWKILDPFVDRLIDYIKPRLNLRDDFEYRQVASGIINGTDRWIRWDQVKHLAEEVAA